MLNESAERTVESTAVLTPAGRNMRLQGVPNRRLKAVIFDLFGTLVSPFSRKQNEQLLTKIAAVLSADRDGFARMWNYDTVFDRVTGVFPTTHDNIEHICRSLGVQVDEASLHAATQIRVDHTRLTLEPRPDAIATLIRLRNSGIHSWIGQQLFCSRAVGLARNPSRPAARESGLLLLGGSDEARS